MADETNRDSDILSQLQGLTQSNNQTDATLKSIDASLKSIMRNVNNISMSDARSRNEKSPFKNTPYRDGSSGRSGSPFSAKKKLGSFTDEFENTIFEELLGKDFKNSLNDLRNQIVKDLGGDLSDLRGLLGRSAAKSITDEFKNSKLGQGILNRVQDKLNGALGRVQTKYNEGVNKYFNGGKVPPMGEAKPGFARNDVKVDFFSAVKGALGFNERDAYTIQDSIFNVSLLSIGDVGVEDLLVTAENATVELPKNIGDSEEGELPFKSNDSEEAMADFASKSMGDLSSTYGDILSSAESNVGDYAISMSEASQAASGLTEGLTEGALGAEAATSGLVEAFGLVAPEIALAVEAIKYTFTPAIKGAGEYIEAQIKAANRNYESAKKNVDEAQKRLSADVESMVRAPFDILSAAAQKWYDTWDQNLRVINATQGYTKAELQDLMASYAERLRGSDLTAVVSAADISDNLAKVIQAGMTGGIAEEFAYLATVLNAAIPTQDFFQYADTYASLAANAIANGKSQAESIAIANEELMSFANNLLYAGREVSGGFTSGLKDASNLFKQSAEIALASRTGDASDISSVLTAVSAITGAIAPDLASAMTDLIYNAAVGGNSDQLVAIRSLAGINASNTEFLRQLAENPKAVFTRLFESLSQRQRMSEGAYMEVAEGLAEVFGVSADAFARVDFGYLAQAISRLDTSSGALSENLKQLQSGETTTTQEQLKMQQINQVILDEGLSYVIDNEAARAIQQHMWDEQIAQQLMEASYGVELEGAGLKAIVGIAETAERIMKVINPVAAIGSAIGKLVNMNKTNSEKEAMQEDIAEMIKMGQVSSSLKTYGPNGEFSMHSRLDILDDMTTYGKDLGLMPQLVDLLGGSSEYGTVSASRKSASRVLDPIWSGVAGYGFSSQAYNDYVNSVMGSFTSRSDYFWRMGKSTTSLINSMNYQQGASYAGAANAIAQATIKAQNASAAAQDKANANVESMVNSMEEYFNEDTTRTYEDWLGTAASFGIADVATALENAGYNADEVRSHWEDLQTQEGAKQKAEREAKEEEFWADSIKLLTTTTDWLSSIDGHTEMLSKIFSDFAAEWRKYYIDHTVYNSTFNSGYVDKVLRTEKENSETAIYALADALTENDVKLLLDPTVQTNALLAQILKVASAILNQNNNGIGGISLPDTIAGLSLGIVS